MGDYDLGTARGSIELDASSLARAAGALDLVGNKMVLLGALGAAGFGYAINAAANFEQQLSRFGAVTGAGEAGMERIRQKALQLGQDSAYGATEVIDAFVELGKAGFSVQEVLGGVGDASVHLAAAGEIPLAKATDTLAIAMRSFKLDAGQAEHVADLLAGTANATLSSVDDLATSFRYAAPVAQTLGISVDDTVTALGLFSQVGIKGSMAGTSLRGMFVALTNASGPAKDKMRELGIITEDGANIMFDANGKAKSLGEMFQILKEKTANLTPEQRAGALAAIFQRRALAAAAEAAIQGSEGFKKLHEQASKVTAEEVMEKKLDNLKGSLKILGASLETAAIKLGETFLPALKTLADWLRKAVNWFIDLPQPIQEFIGYALLAAIAFLLIGGAISKIGGSAIKAYKAFKDLGKAIKLMSTLFSEAGVALLTNPLTWIVIAILAVIAAAYLLWTNWDKVWNWIVHHKAIALLATILAAPIAAFVLLIGAAKWLYDNWDDIWNGIKDVVQEVLDFLDPVFNAIADLFDIIVSVAEGFMEFWDSTLWPAIQAAVEFAKAGIQGVMEGIGFLFDILQGIAEGFMEVWDNVIWPAIQVAVVIAKGIIEGAIAAIGFIILIIQGIIDVFKVVWGVAWDAIHAAVSVAKAIIEPLVAGIGWIIAAVGHIVEWLKDTFETVWNAVGPIVEKAAGIITSALGPVVAILRDIVGAARDAKQAIEDLTGIGSGGDLSDWAKDHAGTQKTGGADRPGSHLKQLSQGGWVPGTGNRDTIPAMLTPGEFVLSKKMIKDLSAGKKALGDLVNTKAALISSGYGIIRSTGSTSTSPAPTPQMNVAIQIDKDGQAKVRAQGVDVKSVQAIVKSL